MIDNDRRILKAENKQGEHLMSHIFVRSERIIEAAPEEIFATLADYQDKRPRMLTPHFLNYKVERGGHGEGTTISYTLQVGGRERFYQMAIDEPQKGHLLTERDSNSSLVTRWSVRELEEGIGSRVTVESDWEGAKGVGGFFERTFAPIGLHRIYKSMLHALALLTQAPEKTQKIMLLDKKNRPNNTGLAMLAVGSALAVAIGVGYLRVRHK